MSARIMLHILFYFVLFIFLDELILKTYQQLILMGFRDDIAFEAATKCKNLNKKLYHFC